MQCRCNLFYNIYGNQLGFSLTTHFLLHSYYYNMDSPNNMCDFCDSSVANVLCTTMIIFNKDSVRSNLYLSKLYNMFISNQLKCS